MADEKDFVYISSSDDDDDDEEEEEFGELEETDEDISLSADSGDWTEEEIIDLDADEGDDDDEDRDGDGEEHGGNDDDDNEESQLKKVTRLLEEGCDLKGLKVKECKAYLRKHGLRLAGTKAECIERIIEHWRIKDGNVESVYPKSSFVINCKGDVCKGDVVFFRQKVYQKFEKMKRHGKLLGTRSVAGKVVKESYGADKQQHTFTIEVLWSKGVQKLPPLSLLLVKGRNLYRFTTFRQPWDNEAERLKVLSEKHERGAAARKARDMRKAGKKQSAVIRGERDEKHGKLKKPYQTRKTKSNPPYQNITADSLVGTIRNPSMGHQNPTHHIRNMSKASHPYDSRSQNQFNQRPPSFYSLGSTSNTMGSAFFDPYSNTSTIPAPDYRNYYSGRTYSNPRYHYGVRDMDHFSEMTISHRPREEAYGQRKDGFRPNHG